MKVNQVKDLVNSAVKQVTGVSALLKDDLSNVVDVGNELVDTDNVDNYVKKLVDRIGQVAFNNRVYQGKAPSVLMSSWEYGSILEKIDTELPTAEDNPAWQLQDGQTYDPNKFYQAKVSAKFYNSKQSFNIPLSFTQTQVKESFANATQLNSFISMLDTSVTNAMTVNLDELIMKTINNFTGSVLNGSNAMQKVNLLKLYNAKATAPITADKALTNSDFIKFANLFINTTRDRLTKISTLFNAGKKNRFTPLANQHLILLSDLASASKVYLESNTYHDANVQLDSYETVPFWQGSGTDYGFNSTSAIDVAIKDSTGSKEVKQTGILGVLFDSQALGVACTNQHTTTAQNPLGEFYTNFNKFDGMYFNDLNENFVVFYIADDQK